MKITLFDPYNGKFTNDMVEWWEKQGHEVQRQTYYNPELVLWADVVWFDTCDNNLLSATNPSQALKDEWAFENRPGAWDIHEMDLTNKKIIVRPIDIEVWHGHHAYDNMWDVVDDVIFLAPHIQEVMMADSRPQTGTFKQHVIPCGVNLERFTFAEHKKGFNVGVVSELWESKGVDLALQVALKLKDIDDRYNIKWLGKNQMYHWGKAYFDDFVEHHGLNIELIDFVDSVDSFLDDKNYLLHCSAKEAYSYATAEAMAKGIKPVLHRYFGANSTWPGITWSSIDEAVKLITEDTYDSQSYRQYLIDHNLTLPQMMSEFDKVIKGE